MAGKKKEVVFIVDDDEMFLKAEEHFLKNNLPRGIAVRAFSTGEECLDQIWEKPFIVILDYSLDGTKKDANNGLEILKKIKKQSPKTGVLMVSGADNLEIANNCIDNGAYDFIHKSETALVKTKNVIGNVYEILINTRKIKAQRFLYLIVSAMLIILYIILYYLHKHFPFLFD